MQTNEKRGVGPSCGDMGHRGEERARFDLLFPDKDMHRPRMACIHTPAACAAGSGGVWTVRADRACGPCVGAWQGGASYDSL